MAGNLLLEPNLPGNPSWTTGAGAYTVSTAFAMAPDGTMTAFRLFDLDAGNVAGPGQSVTIAADTSPYVLWCWIQKTISATNFPSLDFRYGGGAKVAGAAINSNTGVITPRVAWVPEYFGIRSYSTDYWLAFMGSANAGYTSIDCRLSPAFNTDASGVPDPGAEGPSVMWTPSLARGTSPQLGTSGAFFLAL